MQLNKDSFKEISKVTDKNYYFRLDDKNRLTLEVTDQKDLQECVAITTHTIKQITEMPIPDNGWIKQDNPDSYRVNTKYGGKDE